MAEVSDYTIIHPLDIVVRPVAGSDSDPVEATPYAAGGHTGADAVIELLYRGLRSRSAEVHLNGGRIGDLQPHPSATEGEWFHHTFVVPGKALKQTGNHLEFVRTVDDQYVVANAICNFKQRA